MRISIVINCDTRAGFDAKESSATKLFNGCVSTDFLTDGVYNKIKFFDGFEKEVILFVDEHNAIPECVLSTIRQMVDTLIIRKHSKFYGASNPFGGFNDLNYINALSLARGDVVAHFDGDCSAFTKDKASVDEMIYLLDKWNYISYPSRWSPKAIDDLSFDHVWCSTRFFLCKRETLDFTEIEKCLTEPNYMWCKYGDKKRRLSWTEHILGITSNSSVFYPPIQLNKLAIFCWNHYLSGTLAKLNAMTYSDVERYINSAGGVVYPADVRAF